MNLKRLFTSAALGATGAALGQIDPGLGMLPVSYGVSNLAASTILGSAMAAMPYLWNLNSDQPPTPKKETFAGFALLRDFAQQEKKPLEMSKLRKAFRMSIVGAMAVYATGAHINDIAIDKDRDNPVIIVADHGATSPLYWDAAALMMNDLIDTAEQKGKPVILVPSANADPDQEYSFMSAAEARNALLNLGPVSWKIDRGITAEVLQNIDSTLTDETSVFWFSNGLKSEHDATFASALESLGEVTIYEPTDSQTPHMLALEENTGTQLTVRVSRENSANDAETISLVANNQDGEPLLQTDAVFEEGAHETLAVFEDIPSEIRQDLASVVIADEPTSAATLLLDTNWSRRNVGLIGNDIASTLFDGTDFIHAAIRPYTNLAEGDVFSLSAEDNDNSAIFVTDDHNLLGTERDALLEWVQDGGMLVRFAGPNLAAQSNVSLANDPLLPVPLRRGEKATDSALLGNEDGGRVAPFPDDSPFQGIAIPENLSVSKTILAQPRPDLQDYTWASLEDGTPLVTARQEGENGGMVVLVHTSADMSWSNMQSQSAFYLDFMQSFVTYSQGLVNKNLLNREMPPYQIMNADGDLVHAPQNIRPLTQEIVENNIMDAVHPPGIYGSANDQLARNVSDAFPALESYDAYPNDAKVSAYNAKNDHHDFSKLALTFAFIAAFADLAYGMSRRNRKTPAAKPAADHGNNPSMEVS